MKSRVLLTISSFGALALGTVLLSTAIAARAQEAPNYTALYTFTGADGEFPRAT